MTFFVNTFTKGSVCRGHELSVRTVGDLKVKFCSQYNLSTNELRITHNGRHASDECLLEINGTYYVTLALHGGKGGFGSMLRMLGAQIEKTTNHEACRDLSGRRMRDVNNEKKLVDWLDKKAELERERDEKRKAKLEKMRAKPRHVFTDPNYDKQKKNVLENLDDAITQGLQASTTSESTSTLSVSTSKRKMTEYEEDQNKKSCLWMGVGMDDSDSDDEHEVEAQKEKVVEEKTEIPQSKDYENELKHSTIHDEDTTPSENNSMSPSKSVPPVDIIITNKTDDNLENEELDIEKFSSASELESVGLERLKKVLMSRGLKCGGTLQERASRLFSVRGLAQDEIDPSLLAKQSKGKKGKKSTTKK